jgi:hypothetical protein
MKLQYELNEVLNEVEDILDDCDLNMSAEQFLIGALSDKDDNPIDSITNVQASKIKPEEERKMMAAIGFIGGVSATLDMKPEILVGICSGDL